MFRSIVALFFLFLWDSGICQNLDSLHQAEEPIYQMPYDTLMVQQLIAGKLDSAILNLDTIISDIHYNQRIEYLGMFHNNTGATYKLVRYATEESGKHWESPIYYHQILVFTDSNSLIGYYELLHNYMLIELDDGVLKCSPEPGDYDCYPSLPGCTDLKLNFPINLAQCGCKANEGNDDIQPIYFIYAK